MRKAFIILTGILFTLLFATCKQFTEDIDDYLSRWSSEAYITDSSIKAVLQNDLNSIPSVPSAEDVSVTFKLKNPKSFSLDLPPAADPAKKVVVFEHLTQAPVAGTDYTLTQSEDRQSLTLTYKASFLKAHEWGAQDLSSTLSLYAADGRPFKQTYTLKLKANTPPPTPGFTVVKTKASHAYYVLCIKVPDMDKTVPGGLLHKDLARIEINRTSYTFSVNEAQTAFTKPEADVFITHSDVEKLDEPDADVVPADSSWVLYYKTDVEVKEGAAKKDYTIKLIDEKGLVSDIVKASTKPNKAETEIVRITKGTEISGSGSETAPAIIGTDSSGAVLSVSSATANTTVHCTVSEIGGSTPVKYDGNPVDVPLPLNGVSEKKYKLEYYTDGEGFAATPVKTVYYKVVKGHTVSFNVVGGNGSLEGKYGSDQQTATTSPVTLTVPHGYSVTFTATPADQTHYKVGDWTCTPSEGFTGASGQSNASLTVTTDTTVSVQFVQLNALTLSALTIHGKDARAGSVTLSYTITQVGKDDISLAFSGYSTIPFTVTSSSPLPLNLTPGTPQSITINVAASPGNYPEWTKPVSITRAKNDKAKLQSFTLNGETKTADANGDFASEYEVASDKAEVKDFSFADGSTGATASVSPEGNVSIPEDTGKTFTITVKAQDGTEKQTISFTVKRKKYDVNYSVDGVGGKIKAGSDTAVTSGSTKVEYGESISFIADPDTSNGYEVDSWSNNVTVDTSDNKKAKLSNVTETTNKTVTVKFKKKAYTVTYRVEIVDEVAGGTIEAGTSGQTTDSTVSVTHGGSVTFTGRPDTEDWKVAGWTVSSGSFASPPGTSTTATLSDVKEPKTVTVKFYQSHIKNPATWKDLARAVKSAPDNDTLTIDGEIKATNAEGDNGVINTYKILTIKGNNSSAALNADSKSGILDAHNTLTLQNITLKNGKWLSNHSGGAGVYVNSGGKLIMKGSSIIENCSADNSGGGVYVSGGTFEMHDTSKITGCSANKEGGGVYVQQGGTFKMHNSSAIISCSANKGGAIFVNGATVNMTNGTLKGNEAVSDGGAIYAQKEDSTASTVTISGGTIGGTGTGEKNKVTGKWHFGGGIFVDDGCTLTLYSVLIIGNEAWRAGGVRANRSTVTMTDCTIKNNKTTGDDDSNGGGVYTFMGTLTMTGCTITGNKADTNGGGLNVEGTTTNITNCTFTGNTAKNGGGIYTKKIESTPATVTISGGIIGGTSTDEANKATGTDGNGGGIYVGENCKVTLQNNGSTGCTITGNTAAKHGGGVYVNGKTFTMSGNAKIEADNDVYLKTGKTITVDGTLSNNPAARITPESYTVTQVLTGNITGGSPQNRKKFTVPPQKVTVGSENWNVFWYIAADGTLKAEVEDSSLLQEVIRSRPNDTPFIIKLGNIGDLQTVEIPGNKKIMLKADRDVTLTCPNNGHDHYKHLQVQRDATLILEGKIKLQGADYGDKDHYALCVEKDGNAEIKDGVTITGFKNTGRGTVFVDGNLTMSGGTITGNKARNKGDGTAYDDGKGGGVYICPNRSFTMTGGTIADNEAGNGGGVYVSADHQQFMYGNFIMKGGTIKNNKATVSSVYSYIEYTGHGGGVCVDGYFTMEGGTITGNQSERNCKAVQAENDFYWYGGDIKDNGGANQTVSGIRAVADRNGGLYYFHNSTNSHKEPS